MSKIINNFPQGTLMKCSACGHACNREYSDYPTDGTPPEKIHITLGTRLAALYCSDPNCRCYTIFAPSSSAVERLIQKYKSK